MIVVVEGPSASGKTTWCRAHAADNLVAEAPASAAAPLRRHAPDAAARYWLERNAARWAEAVDLADRTGLAVCDTDPLKLHYVWSLTQIGVVTEREWEIERRITRAAIADRRLGYAHWYCVEVPDTATLDARMAADGSRRRGQFALHRRLGAELSRWYEALSEVLPGRVRWTWELPSNAPLASERSDLETFDAHLYSLEA